MTAVDVEAITEVMRDFGESFADLGYDFVAEEINDPAGDIGSAVASPCTVGDLLMIRNYLMEIKEDLVKEPPSEEREQGIVVLQQTWAKLQQLVPRG